MELDGRKIYILERIKQLEEIQNECSEVGSEGGVRALEEDIEEARRDYMRLVRNARTE